MVSEGFGLGFMKRSMTVCRKSCIRGSINFDKTRLSHFKLFGKSSHGSANIKATDSAICARMVLYAGADRASIAGTNWAHKAALSSLASGCISY